MKHRFILLTFTISLLLSCSSTKVAQQHQQQLRYLPKEFHNTYLGMPLEEFKTTRKNVSLEADEEFRLVYIEKHKKGDVKETTYYFGSSGTMPLYEYIIDYHSMEKRDEFVKAKLGSPNSGEEWIFDSEEGFQIKAWLFQNKLVVVGVIKDTEWGEEEYND